MSNEGYRSETEVSFNMKYLTFTILLVIMYSCNSGELKGLKNQNLILKSQIEKQQKELDLTRNAIVIPYDSLHKYTMPVTFGPDPIATNEEVTFQTMLAWTRFPKELEVKWEITQGEAQLVSKDYRNELNREVIHKFSSSGEKEIYGDYIITFPNGKTRKMTWGRYVKVN
jgi:hypothetical protein